MTNKRTTPEMVFSYGTLQLESVQIATFGRRLSGTRDILPGFDLAMYKIEDADVVATSGETHHPIARFTGQASDTVPGTVFTISAAELENADIYEVPAYKRVLVVLQSGLRAWAYVDAQHTPRGD